MEHRISRSPQMGVDLDATAVGPHSMARTAPCARANMANALRIPPHQTSMDVMDVNALREASALDTCAINAIL